jgi:nitrate/nitrite transporter NarK
VVWYTGQFYALFFLTITLKLGYLPAYLLVLASLIIGTPFYILFGWLSDRIGRLKIILAGCVIAALTYFPLFAALTHYVNPDLEKFQKTHILTVTVDPATCQLNAPWNIPTPCDAARDALTKGGLSFTTAEGPRGSLPSLKIEGPSGTRTVESTGGGGWAATNAPKWIAALNQAGYPTKADPAKFNWVMIEVILTIMVIYVTMVYGPIAAFLVEMFPTKIRYTSMSLPYHIGNGWFGGVLPLVATAMVAHTGNIYYGLWYPISVAVMSFIIGTLFLRDTKDTDIVTGSAAAKMSA